LLSLPWLLYTHMTELNVFGKHEVLCQEHFPSVESCQAYATVFAVVDFLKKSDRRQFLSLYYDPADLPYAEFMFLLIDYTIVSYDEIVMSV